MTPDERFSELRSEIVGKDVTDRQLAGNSLSLWVNMVPGGGGTGWTLWFEPSWHVVNAERVLAGSMQASDEDDETGFHAVTEAIDLLVGHKVEGVEVEPVTGDLLVYLSAGIKVRSFTSDPREMFHWRINDYGRRDGVSGSANGLEIYEMKEPKARKPG
jgi:hypothetical protein